MFASYLTIALMTVFQPEAFVVPGNKALEIARSRGLYDVQPIAIFPLPGSVEQMQVAMSCRYEEAGFAIPGAGILPGFPRFANENQYTMDRIVLKG